MSTASKRSASDERNSSPSPSRSDYHHDTSGRDEELDVDVVVPDRRRYGNVYGSAKQQRAAAAAVLTATATVGPPRAASKGGGGGVGGGNMHGNKTAGTEVVPLKLEHKRARNREAASRCRKRKLDRIAALEARVAELNQDNEKLLEITSLLTNQVGIVVVVAFVSVFILSISVFVYLILFSLFPV